MAIKHKICLLGAASVGKTSLLRRYVRSLFDDAYRTTVGVTIEGKRMRRQGVDVDLVIWDLSGEDEFQTVNVADMEGASGYLLLVDGTRGGTLATARALHARVEKALGPLPFVLVVNKADLAEQWEIGFALDEPVARKALAVVRTSAKTGHGVEHAFGILIDAFLERAREHAQ